jgi:multiple sugar transport system permease protein
MKSSTQHQAKFGPLEKAFRLIGMNKIHIHLLLVVVSGVTLAPYFWALSTSLKYRIHVFTDKPQWIPNPVNFKNYTEVFRMAPFGIYLVNTIIVVIGILAVQMLTMSTAAYAFSRLQFKGSQVLFVLFFRNSLIVAIVVVTSQLLTAALAGYALAWIDIPGRNFIFGLILATMMIPAHATAVPSFLILRRLGWIDSLQALMVPFLAQGFAIFLMRQAFLVIPLELVESAKLDGAGHFRILFSIMLPLAKPTAMTVVVLSAVATWNNYFWPLIFTTSIQYRTLPLGLAMFRSQEGMAQWNLLMAASMIVVTPMMLLFLLGQRYFIEGIAKTGLKG